MTGFEMLRKRYSDFLTGSGIGDYVQRMDVLTERNIVSINKNISALYEKYTLKAAEAIEGMSYSSAINAVFQQLYEMSVSFSQISSRYYHNSDIISLIIHSLEKMSDI